MTQRTYRANGYSALADALIAWQRLPISELIARVDRPAESSLIQIDGEEMALDIWVKWVDAKREALRICGVVNGMSHLHIERLEESAVVRLQAK